MHVLELGGAEVEHEYKDNAYSTVSMANQLKVARSRENIENCEEEASFVRQ